MKTRFLSLTLMASLAAGALALADAPGAKSPPDPEIVRLQKQVTDLESRTKTLEKRCRELEAALKETQLRQRPRIRPPGSFRAPPVFRPRLVLPGRPEPGPRIWGERQINGWTFYIVPCAASSKSTLPAEFSK